MAPKPQVAVFICANFSNNKKKIVLDGIKEHLGLDSLTVYSSDNIVLSPKERLIRRPTTMVTNISHIWHTEYESNSLQNPEFHILLVVYLSVNTGLSSEEKCWEKHCRMISSPWPWLVLILNSCMWFILNRKLRWHNTSSILPCWDIFMILL